MSRSSHRHRSAAQVCATSLLLFPLCLVPLRGFAQGPVELLQSRIVKLEATLNQTWNTCDVETAKRLVADEFRGISSSGRSIDKAEVLHAIETNQEGETQVADERVRLFPTIAIYTALVTDHVKQPDGSQRRLRTRITDIWTFRDHAWVLLASQETLVKD